MGFRRAAFLLALYGSVVISVFVPLPAPFTERCIIEYGENRYDPIRSEKVKWYTVDLSAPAEERFKEIATDYAEDIAELIDVVKDLLQWIPFAEEIIDVLFAQILEFLPEPYKSEIIGISHASEIPVGQVVLYNIFYEVFTVCTSIVAQAGNGTIYHARNLDFGLFLGWDYDAHEWMITEVLRKMIVNINWVRDGKLVFKSNNFAGFVGVYNGLRPDAFTITANERFQLIGGYYGMFRYLLGLEPDGQWMTWHVRRTLEECDSYESAVKFLSESYILSPVYYIVGGAQPFQGAIITRSLNATDLVVRLDPQRSDGWYLLQTNYDPDKEPLYLDDRNVPGHHCMKVMSQENVGFRGIFNVLSSQTNLNKLTAYTVLMSAETGEFETHIQTCPGHCWPF